MYSSPNITRMITFRCMGVTHSKQEEWEINGNIWSENIKRKDHTRRRSIDRRVLLNGRKNTGYVNANLNSLTQY